MASKTLLSAVELELFSHLEQTGALTGDRIDDPLSLHQSAIPDFPDTLLRRGSSTAQASGPAAKYTQHP